MTATGGLTANRRILVVDDDPPMSALVAAHLSRAGYRLNVLQVELPPLRARGGDILLTAQHFVELFAKQTGKRVVGLSAAAAEKLLDYAWPGNVRELRNSIERAVALTRHEELTVEDLPEKVRSYQRTHIVLDGGDETELVTLEEIERRYVLRVMESAGGNKRRAAQILGLDRTTLYRKLDRFGLGGKREEA